MATGLIVVVEYTVTKPMNIFKCAGKMENASFEVHSQHFCRSNFIRKKKHLIV